MNNVMIAGNVGRDAVLRSTNTGTKICFFSVADDQWRSDKPIWWSCSIIGERAEKLSQYIKKGKSVTVVGILRETGITDKETGEIKIVRDLAVSQITFHSGSGSKGSTPTSPTNNEQPTTNETYTPQERRPEFIEQGSKDDDLNAPDPDDPDSDVPHYARHGWEDIGEL